MEKLNEKDLQLIEAYIDRNITEEQQEVFRQKMASDENFRKEVILHEAVVRSMHKQRKQALKDELKKWADQPEVRERCKKQEKKTPIIRIGMGIAASIFAAISLFFMHNEHNQASLYAGHYISYPADHMMRGEHNVSLDKANNFYATDQFLEAEAAFEILVKENNSAKNRLFLANCYMKNEKWDKAEQSLLQIVDSGSELVHEAKWFLSLVYLKENDQKMSKELLLEVKNDQKIYSRSAEKLLQELN